jgi:hypothetical protein
MKKYKLKLDNLIESTAFKGVPSPPNAVSQKE